MSQALARPSLKNSWAYQYRMQVTAVVMGAAWGYVALSRPWFDPGSAIDWLLDGAAWAAFLGGALFAFGQLCGLPDAKSRLSSTMVRIAPRETRSIWEPSPWGSA